MPKGKPLVGKREPGGGRKPLPPDQQTRVRGYRATDAEHILLREYLRQLRQKPPTEPHDAKDSQ